MAWTIAGNIVYAGCQWGMLVGIAKLGRPEKAGEFALALAISAPVFMFANLQLRSVQATDARRLYRFGDYRALRYVTSAAALCLIGAMAAFSHYARETAWVVLLMALAKTFESISDVFYGVMQQNERMEMMSKSMIVKGLLSCALLNAVLAVTGDLVLACGALAASWLGVLLVCDIPWARAAARGSVGDWKDEAAIRWSMPTLRRLAVLSAPLGLSMMLFSLTLNMPRYFIAQKWGERELGIFAAMAYIIVAGTTVINALGQAATPRLAALFARRLYRRFFLLILQLAGVALALGVPGVVLAVRWGRPVLSLLYRPEYAERADVFAWLMAAGMVGYASNVMGYALTAARLFREGAVAAVAITALTLLACVLLVPRFGLLGAAWATLGSSVAAFVLQSGALALRWREAGSR